MIGLAPLILLSLALGWVSAIHVDPEIRILSFFFLWLGYFVFMWIGYRIWRGHQIRDARRAQGHRYLIDYVASDARWLAAAAIIGANMNRRGNVSIGGLSLACMVLGRRPRKRGRK